MVAMDCKKQIAREGNFIYQINRDVTWLMHPERGAEVVQKSVAKRRPASYFEREAGIQNIAVGDIVSDLRQLLRRITIAPVCPSHHCGGLQPAKLSKPQAPQGRNRTVKQL